LVSEHAKPTSACYAESPRWSYFGETDAKNKFTGKSFEIKPTGVAHAILNLPNTFDGIKGYPPHRVNSKRVEEHYSWKKVTTVVSNFLMGSPTIDHYGVSFHPMYDDQENNKEKLTLVGRAGYGNYQSSNTRKMCFDIQAAGMERQRCQ
jgi:hypothetical protein